MFKILLLISNLAFADKVVTCDHAGCNYTGGGSVPVVTNTVSGKSISFDNRTDGDAVLKIDSGVNLNAPLILVEVRNSNNSADLRVDTPSRFDRVTFGSNNALKAPSYTVLFDSINNITMNQSGNVGNAGDNSSLTCLQNARTGLMDNQYGTGSTIRDLVMNRRTVGHPSYNASASQTECDATDVTAIRALMADPSKSCQPGYVASAGWGNSQNLKHIKPKRFCAPSGFAFDTKRCQIYTERYYCGMVLNEGSGVKAGYGPFSESTHDGKLYANGGTNASYQKTAMVHYDPSFAISKTGSGSGMRIAPLYSSPVLKRSNATFELLRETYYTSVGSSTTKDYVVYANSYAQAVPKCKTVNPPFTFPRTVVSYSGFGQTIATESCDYNWLTGGTYCTYTYDDYPYEPAGAGTSTYFPLKLDEDISIFYETNLKGQECSEDALMDSALASQGYTRSSFPGGNPGVKEISVISGHAATLVDLSSDCPNGTTQFGVVRNYDACAIPNTTTNTMTPQPKCEDMNDTEDVQCSSLSCPEGMAYKSSRTFKGIQFELDGGENGSAHGKSNIVGFRFTGTLTTLTQKGADGAHGQNNLNVVTENRTCSKIEDETLWRSLFEASPSTTDINASYRSTPILTIEEVLFSPITVLPSSKSANVYPDTSINDVKVYSHTDFNIRKLLQKESQ